MSVWRVIISVKILVLIDSDDSNQLYVARVLQNKFVSMNFICNIKNISLYYPENFKNSAADYRSTVYGMNLFNAKKFYNEFVNEEYDTIICTYGLALKTIAYFKKRYDFRYQIYVISTDYSYCSFSLKDEVKCYFLPLGDFDDDMFLDREMRNKVLVSGIPVSENFHLNISRNEARLMLGYDINMFLCVIFASGMGTSSIYKIIDSIVEKPLVGYNILVISDKDAKLMMDVNEKYRKHTNIFSIGFTDKVYLYMRSADVVIAKPDSFACVQALVCNAPLILTLPFSNREIEIYKRLTYHGVVLGGKDVSKTVLAFQSVLLDKSVGLSVMSNQQKYINRNALDLICNKIIDDSLSQQF